MKATVTWAGNRTFVGQTESGHAVAFGTAHNESPKPGPSPMELLLIGTGGCASIDVVLILERGREAIEDCRIELTAERAETEPKVFTKIHMHFVVTGKALNPAKVERAVQLSIDKYCSASAMMAATATLTHDFEIIDTAV